MQFLELNKTIKNKIEHLYNFVGEDVFLLKTAINTIKTATILDMAEFNYNKIDCSKLPLSSLEAEMMTLPIGNDYRLLVLENLTTEQEKYLNKYDFDDGLVVICLNAKNMSNATIVECDKLNRIDLNKYILNYLSKRNLQITEQAIDYLAEATSGDMMKIHNELEKLSAYALDKQVIDIDMVTNLVSNTNSYVIYMLTNAIDKKDYATYQTILNTMSKSQTSGEIYSYLGKYFKRMQYVAIDKNDEELCSILSIKPYALKMARQCVAQNGVKYYCDLYNKYVDLDCKIKSGEISAYNALYQLIF